MKQLLLSILIVIVAPLVLSLSSGVAWAACGGGTTAPQQQILSGAAATGNCNATSVPKLASEVVNVLSIVVGIVAVVMIIYGGFRYITSGGDGSRVASAKTTLIYAVVGLVIAALAEFIVHYVLTQAVKAS